MILISGCLCGSNPSYKGAVTVDVKLRKLVERGKAVPVCPELLGGLSVPRERSEISGGTGRQVLSGKCAVMTESGRDVTRNFIKGAKKTLLIAKKHGIKKAVLKAHSPACGCGLIYDGTFTGKLRKGDGVTSALLKKNSIKLVPYLRKPLK